MPTIHTQMPDAFSGLHLKPSNNIAKKEQTKDFESQNIEIIKQNIDSWIQNPSGIFSSDSYFSNFAKIDSLKQKGRINHEVEWESSKKYINVSEEKYNEAKDYLFEQIDEILLSAYLEEGESRLFMTLLIQATIKNSFVDINQTLSDIESSAANFVYAGKSGDEDKIIQATAKLQDDLATLSSADFLALPNLTQFFTFADSKIPQENMQKIIDSLGIMRKFIDENLSIHKTGSITLKSGATIRSFTDDNGITKLEVSLSDNQMNHLLLNYTHQNFNTILQMLEQREQFNKESSSDALLTQLLKETRKEI